MKEHKEDTRVDDTQYDPPAARPLATATTNEPDPTCEHGTAMDVHCCNCHSGFLFDAESCVCEFETDFTQSFDASKWARAFVSHVAANPSIATDEGTMIGWFANAIMRGYDEYPRRHPAAPFPSREALFQLVEKWRAVVPSDGGPWEAGEAYTLKACADDLEALLRLQDQGRPEESPKG